MADEEAAPAVNEEEVKDEGNAAPDDGDSGDDDGASDGADEADGEKRIDLSLGMNLEGLSKSALKKLKRKEGKIALEKEKKARRKEKQKQEKQERWEKRKEELAVMTPEEKAAHDAAKAEKIAARAALKKAAQEKKASALDSPQNIVIDCDFEDKMDPGAARSMSSQLVYCYGANRRATNPCRLTFAGIGPAVKTQMAKVIRSEEKYIDLFAERKADLVYLTADSPTTLEKLSEKDVYIIGGIVDRNRFKGLTLDKATQQGIRTAKLPLADHLAMLGSKVLTVNQVMDILLAFMELGDWAAACSKAVPQRKKDEGKEEGRGGKRQKLEGGGHAETGGDGGAVAGEAAASAGGGGEGADAGAGGEN